MKKNNGYLLNFLVVGAHKSGITLLYKNDINELQKILNFNVKKWLNE